MVLGQFPSGQFLPWIIPTRAIPTEDNSHPGEYFSVWTALRRCYLHDLLLPGIVYSVGV